MRSDIHNITTIKENTILRRLQDAVEGINSFQTTWSTFRVIRKAAEINCLHAIPLIRILAEKEDERQLYTALHALIRLKAKEAASLFRKYADDTTQQDYIRNLAREGLLTVLTGSELDLYTHTLFASVPSRIRQAIKSNDETTLTHQLKNELEIEYFPLLYQLSNSYPALLPSLWNTLREWECEQPYFKYIRAIYRLAEIRDDYPTLSLLARLIEKEPPMWGAAYSYQEKTFHPGTKRYFQKQATTLLNQKGKSGKAQAYLELVTAFLLQYNNNDYHPELSRPLTNYAQRDYTTRQKYFLINRHPECCNLYLLSTILFGNDPERKLSKKLVYTYPVKKIYTKLNYYNEEKLKSIGKDIEGYLSNTQPEPLIKSIIKQLFGSSKKPVATPPPPEPVTEVEKTEETKEEKERWFELYPEHWEAMPETYVRLLLHAKMDLIHQFAYSRLKQHPRYNEICRQISGTELIALLNSSYPTAQTFGLELLRSQSGDSPPRPELILDLLNRDSAEMQRWAQEQIKQHQVTLSENSGFLVQLIFHPAPAHKDWTDRLLRHLRFTEEKQYDLLQRSLIQLATLTASEQTTTAQTAIKRIRDINGSLLYKAGWDTVEGLTGSPLSCVQMLAADITAEKASRLSTSDIPVTLIEKFLNSSFPEVRENGLRTLSRYNDSFLANQTGFLLRQTGSSYKEVLTAILERLRRLSSYNTNLRSNLTRKILQALIQKEKFEDAHTLLRDYFVRELKTVWNQALSPDDITRLIHAPGTISQQTGYEVLTHYTRLQEFTLEQVISFGSHHLPALREWCCNFFRQNISRIHTGKKKSLTLANSSHPDTRRYAIQFFTNNFSVHDWENDMLIYLMESPHSEVRAFGEELFRAYAKPQQTLELLLMQSEHPDLQTRMGLLDELLPLAAGRKEVMTQLIPYFRSILLSTGKTEQARQQLRSFLHTESLNDPSIASLLIPLLEEVSRLSKRDKEQAIYTLTAIKRLYPGLDMQLVIKE